MIPRRALLTCSCALLCWAPLHAHAQDNPDKPYDAALDVVIKPGSQRTLGYTDAMLPILQTPDNMLYGDIRFMLDDNSEKEMNLGLGYRHVVFGDAIVGGYGFFDRRLSAEDNYFSQATIGAEFLKDAFEFRLNGYVPLTDEKQLPGGVDGLSFSGTSLVLSESAAIEESLKGFDIEGGLKIPGIEWDTRAFAGYYHFTGDKTDSEIDGGRARFYTEPAQWLRLGGEVQHDNERDTNYMAEVRVRIPFGGFSKDKPEGIRARMMEPVVRDIDIVTQSKKTQTSSQVGVAGANGETIDYYVVDNTAAGGGDGTFERPFNTLAAAEAAAGAGDTIYVRSGNGTTAGMNGGITLSQQGSRLIGSGVDLTPDVGVMNLSSSIASQIRNKVIAARGTAPVLTNTGGEGVTIEGDGVTVSGIKLSGTSNSSFFVNNADNVRITDNIIENSGNAGIYYNGNGNNRGSGIIADNVITAPATDGIFFDLSGNFEIGSADERFIVSGNEITSANNSGFYIPVNDNAAAYFQFEDNLIDGTSNAHGFAQSINNNSFFDAVYKSNTIKNVNLVGITSYSYNNSRMRLSIEDNEFEDNDEHIVVSNAEDVHIRHNNMTNANNRAVSIFNNDDNAAISYTSGLISDNYLNGTSNSDIMVLESRGSKNLGAVNDRFVIFGNTMTNSRNSSIWAPTYDNSEKYLDIGNNTMENAQRYQGIALEARGNSTIDTKLRSNIIRNNNEQGVLIMAYDNSAIRAEISGNTITGNAANANYGVDLLKSGGATLVADLGGGALGSAGGNRIFNNNGPEILFNSSGNTLFARVNWWGGGDLPGAEFDAPGGETIDTTGYLTTDPGLPF